MHKDRKPIRRTYLTADEENVIVDLVNRYSARGFPLSNGYIGDSVEILVASFPTDRRARLPFVKNRPGKTFFRNFRARRSDRIRFRRCSKEEELRWSAGNADVLTTHLIEVHKIIADNRIDSYHIANLDETDISPNRDSLKSSHKKAYVTRSSRLGCSVQRSPEFRNIERLKSMPVVFASGCIRRPLFVVKGKSLNYSVTRSGAGVRVETIADCLPNGNVITFREDIAGVDSQQFYEWTRVFVDDNKIRFSSRQVGSVRASRAEPSPFIHHSSPRTRRRSPLRCSPTLCPTSPVLSPFFVAPCPLVLPRVPRACTPRAVRAAVLRDAARRYRFPPRARSGPYSTQPWSAPPPSALPFASVQHCHLGVGSRPPSARARPPAPPAAPPARLAATTFRVPRPCAAPTAAPPPAATPFPRRGPAAAARNHGPRCRP